MYYGLARNGQSVVKESLKGSGMEISYLQQKFNRHIGRVLTFLDAGKVSPELKQLVKGELWTMFDDVKDQLEKEKDYEETKGNQI